MPYNLDNNQSNARRALLRHEVQEHVQDQPWINDPDSVPEFALYCLGPASLEYGPYISLSSWVLHEYSLAAREAVTKLPYDDMAAKHKLPRHIMPHLRLNPQYDEVPSDAYSPGIGAMAEVFEAVARVALREGVPKDLWPEIGWRARHLGAAIAKDGTDAQLLIRSYLGLSEDNYSWDPDMLMLDDETGITTVTPIDDLVDFAKEAIYRFTTRPADRPGVCVALQAFPEAAQGCNAFDQTWRAFGQVVDRLITPDVSLIGAPSVQQEPDPYARITISSILLNRKPHPTAPHSHL